MREGCIRRVVATPVRVPIPRERIQDAAIEKDRCEFADVPVYVIEVSGETGPSGWCDVNRLARPALLEAMGHALLGRTARELAAEHRPIFELVRPGLGETVRTDDRAARREANCGAGVEIAAIDWAARQLDMPLWRVWGAQCRDRVLIHLWAGWRTPEGAAAIAREALARGFSGLKFKADGDTDAGALVDAVRGAAGDQLEVTIDPNGSWRTVGESLEHLGGAHRRMPRMILEDPVYRDLEVMAALRAEGVRIGLSTQTAAGLREAVTMGAADCFNIGGPNYAQVAELAAEAERWGKPAWMSSSVPTPLGDLALLHMASTFPACTLGSDQVSSVLREDDLLEEPVVFERGYALLPNGAGTGGRVDRAAVARYTVGEVIVCE